MTFSESEPRYVISIAARIVGIEAHTLRYYEKLGLVRPQRSKGRIRYYSEADIERLREIKTLMDDLGVNLAGVEVVFHLVERIADMQRQIQQLEEKVARLRKPIEPKV